MFKDGILNLPSTEASYLAAFAFALFVLGAGLLLCLRRSSPSDSTSLFIIAFAVRICVGSIFSLLYLGQDEVILHDLAKHLAREPVVEAFAALVAGQGYPVWISLFYRVLGPNIVVPKVINILLGSLLPLIAYDILRVITPNPRVARWATYLTIFAPPLLIYSTMNLKEIPCAFLLLLTLRIMFVNRSPLMLRALKGLVPVVGTYLIRGAWAVFPLMALGMSVLLQNAGLKMPRVLSVRGIVILALLMGILVGPLRPFVDGALSHIEMRIFIGAGATWGSLQSSETSVTRSLLDVTDPWAVRNIAIQLARVPFTPSPLTFFTDLNFASWIDGIVGLTQYVLIPFAFIGAFTYRRRKEVLIVALVEASLLAVAGLSLMFGMTIQRHIIPHFATLSILASLGFGVHRHSWVLHLWIIGVFLFSCVFIFTRFNWN